VFHRHFSPPFVSEIRNPVIPGAVRAQGQPRQKTKSVAGEYPTAPLLFVDKTVLSASVPPNGDAPKTNDPLLLVTVYLIKGASVNGF
jgi:hypothetical protein